MGFGSRILGLGLGLRVYANGQENGKDIGTQVYRAVVHRFAGGKQGLWATPASKQGAYDYHMSCI